jgi:hypothetical protein
MVAGLFIIISKFHFHKHISENSSNNWWFKFFSLVLRPAVFWATRSCIWFLTPRRPSKAKQVTDTLIRTDTLTETPEVRGTKIGFLEDKIISF